MDGSFLLDASRLSYTGSGLDVSGDHVDPLHYNALVLGHLAVYPAGLPLIFTGYHQYIIAPPNAHYTTSGAKETILMNPFSLSSRATGPKIRVPRGRRFS
jgi:hypothetical protein